METTRIQSYSEFWKFYVGEHSKAVNRKLHFIGTLLVLTVAGLSVVISLKLLLLMPVVGYFFAWLGHFGFEKNRPATFKYPLWSIRADFRMFWLILTGRMNREIERYGKKNLF